MSGWDVDSRWTEENGLLGICTRGSDEEINRSEMNQHGDSLGFYEKPAV